MNDIDLTLQNIWARIMLHKTSSAGSATSLTLITKIRAYLSNQSTIGTGVQAFLNFNCHFTMENKPLSIVLNYLFVFTLATVSGFNLDAESPVIYEGPSQSELFGYAVATHSYNGKQW